MFLRNIVSWGMYVCVYCHSYSVSFPIQEETENLTKLIKLLDGDIDDFVSQVQISVQI